MKSILIISLLLLGFHYSQAQDKKEKEKKNVSVDFQVKGVCEMCEKRIETAAIYTKGVKFASWNKENQTITVVYNSKLTSEEKVQENIANAGHDTPKVLASQEAYNKLPDCCRYRDGVKVH